MNSTDPSVTLLAWTSNLTVPVEPEEHTLRAVQRTLATRTRRGRQPNERPYPTRRVPGALPAPPALRRARAGRCWSGDRRPQGPWLSAPRAPRTDRRKPVSLAAHPDTRPAVGTVSPSGGDHRGGELRHRFDARASKPVLDERLSSFRSPLAVAWSPLQERSK